MMEGFAVRCSEIYCGQTTKTGYELQHDRGNSQKPGRKRARNLDGGGETAPSNGFIAFYFVVSLAPARLSLTTPARLVPAYRIEFFESKSMHRIDRPDKPSLISFQDFAPS